MKKFMVLLIVLCVFAVVFPASADCRYWRYSAFGSTEGVENLFDGEMFSLSLYLGVYDTSAYIVETDWKDGKPTTYMLSAKVKSLKGDNHLYFVLDNGNTIKGRHHDNGVDFWLDFDGGSIRLYFENEFNPYLDLIGGKYAKGTP